MTDAQLTAESNPDTSPVCSDCANVRNVYGGTPEPGDAFAVCDVVKNLVTGFRAPCHELRTVGTPKNRCGLTGFLFKARA